MEGAIIILLVTVAVGLVLYVYDRMYYRKKDNEGNESAEGNEEGNEVGHEGICCGRHLICEKSLSPMPGEKPIYFDDEELDRFAGKNSDEYSDDEIEEFRQILYTMLPSDIPGWVRSLQLRQIEIPTPLRDEIILLLD